MLKKKNYLPKYWRFQLFFLVKFLIKFLCCKNDQYSLVVMALLISFAAYVVLGEFPLSNL